jgi:hypothetical protein
MTMSDKVCAIVAFVFFVLGLGLSFVPVVGLLWAGFGLYLAIRGRGSSLKFTATVARNFLCFEFVGSGIITYLWYTTAYSK